MAIPSVKNMKQILLKDDGMKPNSTTYLWPGASLKFWCIFEIIFYIFGTFWDKHYLEGILSKDLLQEDFKTQ